MADLTGKVAVITGGGTGLGAATGRAESLERHCDVVEALDRMGLT